MSPNPNFLSEIIERKRMRLAHDKAAQPLGAVRSRAAEIRSQSQPHRLRRAMEAGDDVRVIAEIKRASPSKGLIREEFIPAELARAYRRGGAVAISVLTEEDYFRGSLEDLRVVRENSTLPILRKDFILDEYQVYETAAAGADALLLIVAALSDEELSRFRRITEEELLMDALVEVHTVDELRRAERCGATLIGVNNRNLHTFAVSLNVSVNLAQAASPGLLLISESGLRSGADLRRLQAFGYHGFLIGEGLMRADDSAEALSTLIREARSEDTVRVKVCGITNLEDALICVNAEVDMLGFNFYPGSPRYIPPKEARQIINELPAAMISVGVFVNEENPERVASIADEAGVVAVQLHGEETPQYCQGLSERFVIKALRVRGGSVPEQMAEYETDAILLDAFSLKAHGGTGERFDWSVAQRAQESVFRLFLAGGLTLANVAEAVEVVRPYAVDVCSSVETSPRQKDGERIRAFVAAAKSSAKEGSMVSE